MFNLVNTIEARIKKTLSGFQKTKEDLKRINTDIIQIVNNKNKIIQDTTMEIDSLVSYSDQNKKIIEKLSNFLN